MSLSNTVRACINQSEIRERQPAELSQLYTEINRIGHNVNQITRKINANLGSRDDVEECQRLLAEIYQLMYRIATP